MALQDSLEDQPPHKRSRPPGTLLDPFESAFGSTNTSMQPNLSSLGMFNTDASVSSAQTAIEASRESSRHSFEQSIDSQRRGLTSSISMLDEITSPISLPNQSNHPSNARPASSSNRSASSSVSGLLSPFDRCLNAVSEECISPNNPNSQPNSCDQSRGSSVPSRYTNQLPYTHKQFNSPMNDFEMFQSPKSPIASKVANAAITSDQNALQHALRQNILNGSTLSPQTLNNYGLVRAIRTPAPQQQGGQKAKAGGKRAPRGRPPSSGNQSKPRSTARQSNSSKQASPLCQPTNGSFNPVTMSPEQFSLMNNEASQIHHRQPLNSFTIAGHYQGHQSPVNGVLPSECQYQPSFGSSSSVDLRQTRKMPSNVRECPRRTSDSSTSTLSEASRIRLLTAQMVLLLHAHQCSQRDKLGARLVGHSTSLISPCQVQQCTAMKCILNHALKCQRGDVCEVQHCSSSKKLIKHWRSCVQPECPICSPIRTSSTLHCTLNPAPLTTTRSCKDWQKSMSPDVRSNLITKIMSSILPPNDNRYIKDNRLPTFVNFIRKLEADAFDGSIDQDTYFYRLAEKAFRIRQDIETSRRHQPDQHSQIRSPAQPDFTSPNHHCDVNQTELGGASTPTDISSTSLTSSNSYRLPYNPDATAGEKGPPNQIAPSALSQMNRYGSTPAQLKNASSANMDGDILNNTALHHGITSRTDMSSISDLNGKDMSMTVQVDDINASVKTEHQDVEMTSETDGCDHIKSEAKKAEVGMSEHSPKDQREEAREKINSEVLHEIFMSDDSIPFRQPVDPVLLNIPDYFDIIKKPMDLSTIKRKLDDLEYDSPWDLIDDMWLMFQNAWTYNKKTSKIYKMCSRLSETFMQLMNTAMIELGYCCGQKHVYLPQVMFCYGNQLCVQIARDAQYHCYINKEITRPNLTNDKYTFCTKCFESCKDDIVQIGDDPNGIMHQIAKSEFEVLKNDRQEFESFVPCKLCGRKWHQVCGLYSESVCVEGFICGRCEAEKNVKCKRNKLTASKLSNNKLGNWIENRVNSFLSKSGASTIVGKVHIRVLACFDKSCETKPRMKQYYDGKIPDKYPFRSKAIFAFQEIDGHDVAFFGLHVQEYDAKAPYPNSGRVYISYLDSVYFFQPKQLRTDVYHEILIGYLDWAKRMGYQWGHIWACPPSEGDDYIFYCHPPDQKVPKQKRLIEWYRKMLDKALLDRVVISYQDIMKDAMENDIKTLNEIPYFDGDFWPNVFEESIKEMEEEEKQKIKTEGSSDTRDSCDSTKGSNQSTSANVIESTDEDKSDQFNAVLSKRCNQKKKTTISKQSTQRKNAAKKVFTGCDLTSKVFATMDKHKEVFFVIRLSDAATNWSSTEDIVDVDPTLTSELMDGRDAFLNFSRERHLEFSSLRRAKYSTMLFLFEIHNQGADRFVYTCNKCRAIMDIRFHCTVCEDYDLCVVCHQMVGHEHPMERLSSGAVMDIVGGQKMDAASSKMIYPSGSKEGQASPQYSRQQSIERCIEILLHAVNCRNANCSSYPGCQKMKLVVQHIKQCGKATGTCQICRQINLLCHPHARVCTDPNCAFPFCAGLKQKMQKQRALNSQLERRRMMTTMQRNMQASSSSTSHPQAVRNFHPAVTISTSSYANPHMMRNAPLGKGRMRFPMDRLSVANASLLQQQQLAYRHRAAMLANQLGIRQQVSGSSVMGPVQGISLNQQYAMSLDGHQPANPDYLMTRSEADCQMALMQQRLNYASQVVGQQHHQSTDDVFMRQGQSGNGIASMMSPMVGSPASGMDISADRLRQSGLYGTMSRMQPNASQIIDEQGIWYQQDRMALQNQGSLAHCAPVDDRNRTMGPGQSFSDMSLQQQYQVGLPLMDTGQGRQTLVRFGPRTLMTNHQSPLQRYDQSSTNPSFLQNNSGKGSGNFDTSR